MGGEILKKWLIEHEIGFEADQLLKFERFANELLRWNKTVNLTAIRDKKQVYLKHFVDSLSLLQVIGPVRKMLDVGSGGGFPGLPIAIMRPDIQICSIDAVAKKISFQRHICRTVGIHNVDAIHGRVESLPESGKYDLIVSRAFTDIGRFVELVERLLDPCGTILLMCGPEQNSDQKSLNQLLAKHHLVLSQTVKYQLPAGAGTRTLVALVREAP
jgi:16S rRNA (guanine527-N7)-methyltransferase